MCCIYHLVEMVWKRVFLIKIWSIRNQNVSWSAGKDDINLDMKVSIKVFKAKRNEKDFEDWKIVVNNWFANLCTQVDKIAWVEWLKQTPLENMGRALLGRGKETEKNEPY